MKRIRLFLKVMPFSIIIFSFILGFAVASDLDSDGIDDDFEELNKRNIKIDFKTNETEIESFLRYGDIIDEIEINIRYDNDGLSFQISYESDYESESETEFEIEFGITFQKLIEYIDNDTNGIYDSTSDQLIQEIELNNFEELIYTNYSISEDTKLHKFTINTTDGVFTIHFYVIEEFDFVNNTLILPSTAKIDIEINDFNYLNDSSQIALYTKLETSGDFIEVEETEDEKKGYATNEKGVLTRNSSFEGIFTWYENASIDGISKRVIVGEIEVDDDDENEQKIYLNYPRGDQINHDPKVGIPNAIKIIDTPTFPWFLIILIVVISAISISVAYTIYHYRQDIFPAIFLESNNKLAYKKKYQKVGDKNGIDKFANLRKKTLTAISKEFLEQINLFQWEDSEKDNFIKEMLNLTPAERKAILKEMIKRSKFEN
ncbi:MAG: hypothetical protein ACFE85_08995 [Candidatus Hodarchaeota archaeon]